ncbi:MAG: hypothetical protein ACXAE3_14705, partial [Candidatus Kariarchaeaceae archaeon]
HPTNDFHPLLELAKEKDVGIQAIKSAARRRWDDHDKRWANTWYEPLREEDWIRRALRYTLSRDGVTTAPMSGDLTIWPMLIQTALDYSAPSDEEIQETIRLAKTDYGMKPLFPV